MAASHFAEILRSWPIQPRVVRYQLSITYDIPSQSPREPPAHLDVAYFVLYKQQGLRDTARDAGSVALGSSVSYRYSVCARTRDAGTPDQMPDLADRTVDSVCNVAIYSIYPPPKPPNQRAVSHLLP